MPKRNKLTSDNYADDGKFFSLRNARREKKFAYNLRFSPSLGGCRVGDFPQQTF
jgi:hypothetical protein